MKSMHAATFDGDGRRKRQREKNEKKKRERERKGEKETRQSGEARGEGMKKDEKKSGVLQIARHGTTTGLSLFFLLSSSSPSSLLSFFFFIFFRPFASSSSSLTFLLFLLLFYFFLILSSLLYFTGEVYSARRKHKTRRDFSRILSVSSFTSSFQCTSRGTRRSEISA